MSGICLMMKQPLTNLDYTLLQDISNYYNSFEDIPHFNPTSENTNPQTTITMNNSLSSLLTSSPNDLINTLFRRGPSFLSIHHITNQTELSENIPKDSFYTTYKELFDSLSETKSLIICSILNPNIKEHQPLINKVTNNILQFNGNIYNILNNNINLQSNSSSSIMFDILNTFSSSNNKTPLSKYNEHLFSLLNTIESDHTFIYHDNLNKTITISKDLYGKHSLLLIYIKSLHILTIASILPYSMYTIRNNPDIIILEIPSNSLLLITPFNTNNKLHWYTNPFIISPSHIRFNIQTPPIINNTEPYLAKQLTYLLNKAVYKRICNISSHHIALTFSGGIDSLLLAYFTILNTINDNNIIIDLFNLSFLENEAPDRNSGIISYFELLNKFPTRHNKINLILVDKSYDNDITLSFKENILSLIYPRQTHMDFNISSALNFASMKKGYKVDNEKLLNYFKLTHPQKELNTLNTIYQNNYNNNILSKQINKIQYHEFINKSIIYESQANVILSGLGADELFGGYSRYKNGDIKEHMSKDLDRIWMRNFGRDDRACCDNGIEIRYPYFDNDLINFLSSIKDISLISDFSLKRGIGEKKLLRNVAKEIGFEICYMFEKRAIQFGTKLAKETNNKVYGSTNKANGKAQYK